MSESFNLRGGWLWTPERQRKETAMSEQWESVNPHPGTPKPIHMADKVNPQGAISPLCAKKPKALNLNTDSWTNRPWAVTCPRCALLIKAQEMQQP